MADNYLITGYWGEPHVTAENDRGINAATFGTGRVVLPVGQKFRAEYIGNNTVRMFDGKLMDNGAAAGIPAGEYVDLLVSDAGQGMNRNDLIVFQYVQDSSTLIESGSFIVLQGAETSGTAVDPELTQEDLLSGRATFDQFALWRVSVSGSEISAPVQLFSVSKNINNAGVSVVAATSGDGVAYSATVPGVSELYAGLEVTIIPNIPSTSTAITLDINGLGAKFVRLPLTTNTAILGQPDNESFFVDNRPVKMIYDPEYAGKGSWVVVGRQLQSANDLYGTVPVQKGGWNVDTNTTDEDKAEALENLLKIGVAPGGYGLGGSAHVVTDCNAALANGWYYGNGGTANLPTSLPSKNCSFFVVARNSAQVYQYFFSTTGGCVLQRYTTDSGASWTEEWINPPMEVGVEYRTTERYGGEAVYVTLQSDGIIHKRTETHIDITPLTYGTEEIEAGSVSPYATGSVHFVIE